MSIVLHNPGANPVELTEVGITLRPGETRDVTRRIGGLLATSPNLLSLVGSNQVRVVRSGGSQQTYWSPTDALRILRLDDIFNNEHATRIPTINDDEADGFSFGSLWRLGLRVWQCVRPDLGAAIWQELIPVASAGVALNRYYGPIVLGETNGGGQVLVQDTLFIVPYLFPPGFFFNRVGFETTSGAGANSFARLSIYNSVNGVPSMLQSILGVAALQNSGQREVAINFTAPGEVFWLSFHANQNIQVRAIRNGLVNTVDVGSVTPTFGASQTLLVPSQPYANGAPLTFPASITSNTNPMPYIWFRRVP